jgi:hypothetical protein
MFYVTRDTLHVRRDTWHMTRDTWCIQNLEDKDDSLSQLINQSVNEGCVCRTAPATLGLFIITKVRLSGLQNN